MTFPLAVILLFAGPTVEKTEPDGSNPTDRSAEYGPFFEDEAPSDTNWTSQSRKTKYPVLSVGNGSLCFVEDSHCKTNLLVSGEVGAGMRIPASNKGPDIPYAHWGVRGGFTIRPMMFSRKAWHPWGVGVVGSWTRGTGSVTVESTTDSQQQASTERTDAWRIAMLNQLWLSRKPHAIHLDFALGTVRSQVLTSEASLFGTHAELGFGWGGWGAVYAGADFLDRDTRVVFGFRAHGVAAGPVIAAALLGLALGGAL